MRELLAEGLPIVSAAFDHRSNGTEAIAALEKMRLTTV